MCLGDGVPTAPQRMRGGVASVSFARCVRYKGVLAVKGSEEKLVFQGVHMVYSGGWPGIKWAKGEKRECRFVFIGRDLDKQALLDGLQACREDQPLRFSVLNARACTYTHKRSV
eukprot:gene11-biopygen105